MAKNRINDYIRDGKNFSFTSERITNLFSKGLEYHPHVEPRIRKDDLTEALSMKVHDPLWMLSRQWQMGEFRGNDAGTAVSVKCKVAQEDCSTDPIEPITEQVNPAIDLLVKVESAMHYLDMRNDKNYDATPEEASETIDTLRQKYGIIWEDNDSLILDCNDTKTAEKELNTQRISFANTFCNKAFDGYQLYCDLVKRNMNTSLAKAYKKWFREHYLPADEKGNSHWQEQALNYTIDMHAGAHHFIGDRYQGGRLSWYTVDNADSTNNISSGKKETISSLPTLAHYAGAPNKRLWQFEDHGVFMGNSTEQQTKANEVFLKFATLYSNDWMLIPLKTAIGKYITIKSIEVKDTFGILHTINSRAGDFFTNTLYNSSGTGTGLFYAPQLAATLDGFAFEEVELLRDEMANMVWGVEKTVSDGCGSTLDEQLKAIQLKTFIDDLYEQNKIKPEPGMVSFSEKKARILVFCNPDMVQEALNAGADYAGLDEYIQKIKDGWTDFDVVITTPNIMPKIGALGRILNPLGLMPSPQTGTVTMDIVKTVQEVKANMIGSKVERKDTAQSDYRYTLQTHVPFNWIPFVPQHIKDKNFGDQFKFWGREMILRRGKMPCHILTKEGYKLQPVLPVTSILRKGLDGKVYEPLFINEEEVQQTGIRLIKNYQRTRWLNGKTYLWLGMYKRLAKFSENSGLEFDTLHEK